MTQQLLLTSTIVITLCSVLLTGFIFLPRQAEPSPSMQELQEVKWTNACMCNNNGKVTELRAALAALQTSQSCAEREADEEPARVAELPDMPNTDKRPLEYAGKNNSKLNLISGSFFAQRSAEFETSAKKFKPITDKITRHKYHFAYGFLFEHLRGHPVKLLEIGLGCGMSYGPGASIPVWNHYFGPQLTLDFLEYDGTCAKKLEAKVHRLFVGDQEDRTVLRRIVEANKLDLYDVIVDDGGHKMQQQIVSWQELWTALKPGGIYVIEDLSTSYMERFGGGFRRQSSTIEYIKKSHDGFYKESPRDAFAPEDEMFFEIHSTHCWHEICAFVKKWK